MHQARAASLPVDAHTLSGSLQVFVVFVLRTRAILQLTTISLSAIPRTMKRVMTKHFSKWTKKLNIRNIELQRALNEVKNGIYEADLGGHVIKKRIRFPNKGKRGSGRVIICYKHNDRAVYIYGFAKNEKTNLSPKELYALKEFGKVLLSLSNNKLNAAIKNGDFIEV